MTERGVEILLFYLGFPLVEDLRGWYWRTAEHKLMRGPFASEEDANADADNLLNRLLREIVVREHQEAIDRSR